MFITPKKVICTHMVSKFKVQVANSWNLMKIPDNINEHEFKFNQESEVESQYGDFHSPMEMSEHQGTS